MRARKPVSQAGPAKREGPPRNRTGLLRMVLKVESEPHVLADILADLTNCCSSAFLRLLKTRRYLASILHMPSASSVLCTRTATSMYTQSPPVVRDSGHANHQSARISTVALLPAPCRCLLMSAYLTSGRCPTHACAIRVHRVRPPLPSHRPLTIHLPWSSPMQTSSMCFAVCSQRRYRPTYNPCRQSA